ncbi:MAG: hypothetical protein ACRCTX_11975 [Afipia sp.]
MWRWALDLSKVRRAHRAATALISPMVEKSRCRLGGISDLTWSDPYMVGFMVMLITIAARIETGKIEGEALCRVQARSWEDITTIRSGIIGEEVLLLSTACNRDFETGCRNAFAFSSMLVGNSILFAGAATGWQDRHNDLQEAGPTIAERDDVSAAWERFFDAHVSVHACDIMLESGRTAL